MNGLSIAGRLSITVKGPVGRYLTARVANPSVLDKLQIG